MKNPLSHESQDRSDEKQRLFDYIITINQSFEALHATAWRSDPGTIEAELALQSAHQVARQQAAVERAPMPVQIVQTEQAATQPVAVPAAAEAPVATDNFDATDNVARLRALVDQTSVTTAETRAASVPADATASTYPAGFLNNKAA